MSRLRVFAKELCCNLGSISEVIKIKLSKEAIENYLDLLFKGNEVVKNVRCRKC